MSKHTPGPWMVSGPSKPNMDSIHGGDYAIMDGGTNIIAEAFYQVDVGSFRPAEANARLISAAPELLEALVDVIGWVPSSESWHTDTPTKSLARARAAIAKAKGETL